METPTPLTDATATQTPSSHSTGLTLVEVPRALDPEWEDAFYWSYSPRFWNVGCG
ncbi:MAG: hypothetical protein HY725_12065 [Candidatus Rokubacteria bacterium]|nr:hypothetical protein [Candidatus Rokubacteria bacterium]